MSKDDEVVKNEIIASDFMYQNSVEYKRDIIRTRFPNPIDGMKQVVRRIMQASCAQQKTKAASALGFTMTLHNHGDQTIYKSMCRLFDKFSNTHPLLHNHSNNASYGGVGAPASRYVDLEFSDFAKDILFRGINGNILPKTLNDDLTTSEYANFVPKIPLALMTNNVEIGYGDGSKTYPMSLENVCDLVKRYIENGRKWNPDVGKRCLPYFPIAGRLINTSKLIDEHNRGNFNAPIYMEGSYTIASRDTIVIHTFGWGVSPMRLYKSMVSELGKNNSFLYKKVIEVIKDGKGRMDLNMIIVLKRTTNPFEVIEYLKRQYKLKGSFHPVPNYCTLTKGVYDTIGFVSLTPENIVELWYDARYTNINSDKRLALRKLQLTIDELNASLLLCDHSEEAINIITKEASSLEDAAMRLSKRFELTPRQGIYIASRRLYDIANFSRPILLTAIEKAKVDNTNLIKSLATIDKAIYDDMDTIARKHPTDFEHTTNYKTAKGLLVLHGLGVITIDSMNEVSIYLGIFKGDMDYIPLSNGTKVTFKNNNMRVSIVDKATDFEKTYLADKVIVDKLITNKDGFWHKGYIKGGTYVNTQGKVKLIKSDGKIEDGTVNSVTTGRRKRAEVLAVFKPKAEEYYVLYYLDTKRDTLEIIKFKGNTKKIPFDVRGMITVVAVLPVGFDKEYVFFPDDIPSIRCCLFAEKNIKSDIMSVKVRALKGRI